MLRTLSVSEWLTEVWRRIWDAQVDLLETVSRQLKIIKSELSVDRNLALGMR